MLTYSDTHLLFGKADSNILLSFDGAVWLIIELNMCVCLVAQSCLTLCNRVDYRRILEWITIPHLGSSHPGNQTCVSFIFCIADVFFNHWATGGVCVKVIQLCPTLCNPMDYTVYGILQPRILEWVTFPFSWGSFQPRDWTQVSCWAGGLYQLSYKMVKLYHRCFTLS